jgi:hypothetical protein
LNKEPVMNVMDILKSYAERPTDTEQDFDEVAGQVPADALGQGLAHAFRSDRTPDFGSMVGSLFGGSNPQQRAGLLGQLISAVGPTLMATLGSGALGRMLKGGAADISPEAAAQVDPQQVRDIATAAEQQDPGVMDRVGAYYAKHPEVVKVLGGAALAIALGQVANRMKR